MNAIELDRVGIRPGGVEVIQQATAPIPKGGVTAIIGPNGAGKTTLLRAILGLVRYSGVIRFPNSKGRNDLRRPTIGYVPQRLDFDRGVPMTVRDFLTTASQRWPVWLGTKKKAEDQARRYLKRVEAEHLMLRPLGRLSGGELQRVQLALALQLEPEIILLDEPVSGVDIVGEHLFCDLLASVQAQSHLTMVMVSHDLSVVSQHATHVICLNRTVLASGPVAEVFRPEILSSAFGPHTDVGDLTGLSAHHGLHGGHGHSHATGEHGPGCKHEGQ